MARSLSQKNHMEPVTTHHFKIKQIKIVWNCKIRAKYAVFCSTAVQDEKYRFENKWKKTLDMFD